MRIIILSALMLSAFTFCASAEALGNMADQVTSDLQGLPEAVADPAYARGVMESAKSLMKIKAQEPNPTGMSSRIGLSGGRLERHGRR